MNTSPNIEADLPKERRDRVKHELRQSFSDPRILQMFDNVLSKQAQGQANRNNPYDAATNPTGIRSNPGVVANAVRQYTLGAETEASYPGVDIDGVESATNHTSIQTAWGTLNNIINEWLQTYPDSERTVMRTRYYNLLHEEVKSVLDEKSTEYTNKLTAINTAVDTYYTEFNRSRAEIRSHINVVRTRPRVGGTVIPNDPRIDAYVTRLDTVTPDYIRINHTTFAADLQADHAAIMTYLSSIPAPPLVPSVVGPPPIENDGPLIAARESIFSSGNQLSSTFATVQNAISTNLTDHSGTTITYDQLHLRTTLIQEASRTMPKPASEEIMSRDTRYQNVQVQTGTALTILRTVTFPNSFSHPRKTAVSATSYTRGALFSVDDYGTYYEWAQANRTKVSTEQAEAINGNAANIVSDINNTLAPQLAALQAQLAARTITVYQVKTQIRRMMGNFFGHLPPPANNAELTALGIPAYVDTPDQMTVIQNLLRWHFNTNSQTDLVNGLSNHLIHRLNLPNTAEQAVHTKNNRESYAEVASNSGIILNRAQVAENRVNYLSSLRAQIYETLQEKYKGRDLTDPKVYQEFSGEFVKMVMQARLDTLNETLKHKEKTWMGKIKEYWQDVNGARLAITAGLTVAALASGIYLDPSVITPAVTAVQSLWTAGVGFIAPHLTGGAVAATVKAVGIGATFAVGQRATRTLSNALAFNMPWSSARYRSKRDVLGTTDANGNSVNGLGDINVATGTYNNVEVQRALASQIAFAENHGGKFAKTDGDSLKPILGDKYKRKLSTSQHLWAREKQGMNAIIKNQINAVAINAAIPPADKNNAMIIAALDSVYNPGGMEDNFLAEIENSRANQAAMSKVGLFSSIAAGAGLAGAFNVRF